MGINEKEVKNAENSNAEIGIDSILILNMEDQIVREKIKQLEERFYHITLLRSEKEKDTIVNLNFQESDEALGFKFNYDPLENRVYEDSISMLRTNIEVVIVKSNFDETKSVIKYDKNRLNIVHIDNHGVFGADDIPQSYISNMYLNPSGHYFEIDKEYYEDLYEPDFIRTAAYYYDKEMIIRMNNSDGYLGYHVVFFIGNKLNMKRIVYQS